MSVKAAKSLLSALKKSPLKMAILESGLNQDEPFLEVKKEKLVDVCLFLRDEPDFSFKVLIDICGVDYPARIHERFDVVYQLLSPSRNKRLQLKVKVAEDDIVPSLTDTYHAAGWFEREVWDLFGVPFSNNPDLRRILTDYGFEGHPLRKDFPLTGYKELRYDETQKRVVYRPVELTQDFRRFDFLSPWEGMTDIQLTGEKKAVKPAYGADFLNKEDN